MIRDRFKTEWAMLPEAVKSISEPETYPVAVSDRLREIQADVKQALIAREIGGDEDARTSGGGGR